VAEDKDSKSKKLETAKPESTKPESEKPKKKELQMVQMVPHPEDEEDISSEMSDLFDEESVKHQHGHAEPEGD